LSAPAPREDDAQTPDGASSLVSGAADPVLPTRALPFDVRLTRAASQDRPAAATWHVAVRAGVAAGRESQKAALTTAGFLSNWSRKMASAFNEHSSR
jgi:hypothetical protein